MGASQIALVLALVALAKRAAPSLDGWKTLVAAALATAVVVVAKTLEPRYPEITGALAVFVGATGTAAFGMWLSDRHAEAIGASMAPVTNAVGDATTTPAILKPAQDDHGGAA